MSYVFRVLLGQVEVSTHICTLMMMTMKIVRMSLVVMVLSIKMVMMSFGGNGVDSTLLTWMTKLSSMSNSPPTRR